MNDLLDVSRLEAGKLEAHYNELDLSTLVCLVTSHFEALAEERRIDLQVRIPEALTVQVDAEKIQRVLLNLLSNAFKLTPDGGVIALRVRDAGEWVHLSVADSGTGVRSDARELIFERFQQAEGAATRRAGGTGLGLHIVREFVRLHGGHIEVNSAPEGGALFSVELPRDAPAGREIHPWTAYPARDLSLEITGLQASPRHPDLPAAHLTLAPDAPTVLVVEDNPDMNAFVARTLAGSCRVLCAFDGQQGLDMALRARPDLIVTDVMMPIMSGEELIRRVRQESSLGDVPIVLLSARADDDLRVRLLREGAQDYLHKPFLPGELLARVSRLLIERSRQQASLREGYERLQAQLGRLNLLHQITRAIGERHDLASIYQVIVHSLEDSLPVDFACIVVRDASAARWTGTMLGAKARAVSPTLIVEEAEGGASEESDAALFTRGELVYEPDVREARIPALRTLENAGFQGVIVAPLRVEQTIFGALIVARRAPDSFSSGECEFLRQLSEHVALAAQQAELHRSLRTAYEDLRTTQRALLQQERLRALGQMAGGIAHDINNAILPISLYTSLLVERTSALPKEMREYLPVIQQAVDGVGRTVQRMRSFYLSRDQDAPAEPVNLNKLVREVIELTHARWHTMPQQRGFVIELDTALSERLPTLLGSEQDIRDALTNLIFNAVDAMPTGGMLTIRTALVEGNAAAARVGTRFVLLEVTDTGMGMDSDTRARCLEPFFTTKGDQGSGLGLAMVYGMARTARGGARDHERGGQRHDDSRSFPDARCRGTRNDGFRRSPRMHLPFAYSDRR